jgi:hypothetical protein
MRLRLMGIEGKGEVDKVHANPKSPKILRGWTVLRRVYTEDRIESLGARELEI